MNRVQLNEWIRIRLGERVAKFWTNDYIYGGMDEATKFIVNSRPKWSWTHDEYYRCLKNGKNVLQFPPNFRVGLEFQVNWRNTQLEADNITVAPCDYADRQYHEDIATEQNPFYYVFRNKIYLLPKPIQDAEYGAYMRFYSWCGARDASGALKRHMVADTDVPAFNENFHEAVGYYVLSLSREKQGEIDIGSEPWQKFEIFMGQLREAENNLEAGLAKGFHNPRRRARRRAARGIYR